MNIVAPEIQNYAENFTSDESALLRELREKTFNERSDKAMLSGFYQGRLLAMFSRIIAPRCVLEIGTFMGYSALCLAEGLTEDGKIITLDISEETNKIAKSFWAQSEYENKIEARLGDALEIIPTLDETFDFVFIDADKPDYSNYYDAIFDKVKIGGVIVADNVLRDGKVLSLDEADENTIALDRYNQKIQTDNRVTNILFAVRDGLMIARKESE